uniref:Glycosyltransferase 2-like domain-containing protein n=1 Tax=viral metagenome TaxID=1070528 RepID=A0A6C0HF63_9ZZZZ
MTILELNKDKYIVNQDDYKKLHHEEYNNLIIYPKVGEMEREIGLINDIGETLTNPCFIYIGSKYASFYSINCREKFQQVYIETINDSDESNIVRENISKYDNINLSFAKNVITNNTVIKIFEDDIIGIHTLFMINKNKPYIIAKDIKSLENVYKHKFNISGTNQYLYVSEENHPTFIEHFYYYFEGQNFNYNNLIHLCIMVKNGGDLFEKTLLDNMKWIDRWTILDTGSTDNTIEIINKTLVGKKKGKLYQEPFINFRESRNRCLDLCETNCKYNVMLDDTYIIQGDFRGFLEEVRGDQFADSYSLLIKSDDTEYYSNRVTKSKNKLRYIYTIHEVIQKDNNTNVVIPATRSWIFDMRADYMENRTMSRKEYDLKCLFGMIEEYPDDPRHLYYIAQTYNLLEKHELAAEYFFKRAFHPVEGFDQEKIDALFEMTRIYNYKLNKPWEECERYYQLVCEWDPERPEGFYFIAIHYYLEGKLDIAYPYFKKALEIGFPVHRQYSLKPTLSYFYAPKFVANLAYQFKDFVTGKKACEIFLANVNHKAVKSLPEFDFEAKIINNWNSIYSFLLKMDPVNPTPIIPEKPIFCFVADGGFNKWSGKNIVTTGVGGSETYIIEMARYLKQLTDFEVVVCCNCEQEEIFEGVKYIHLSKFFEIVSSTYITHCMISRYSEYIPMAIEGHVENIYVILHDLGLTGDIIPIHPKLKNIFCLSEWHVDHFLQTFPQFKQITKPFHYGIDFTNFIVNESSKDEKKVKRSFIYSSFPNRGLLTILNMWPEIIQRYPDATLNIFCDLDNNWVNTFYPQEVEQIKMLLGTIFKNSKSIKNHGWVDKKTLAKYWKTTDIWFYPCKFKETFCLTALEAAATKTYVISNDLAALQNTVGDRGDVIPGDATTPEWKQEAFRRICEYFDNPDSEKAKRLIQKNYEWALTHSWKDRANDLITNYLQVINTSLKYENNQNLTLNNIETSEDEKILKEMEQLNYMDMYNWLQDLPKNENAKQIFKDILMTFKDERCNILEVGTFAGMSLIGMLKYLPNSFAYAIDSWKNYSEKTRENTDIDILKNIEQLNVEQVFYQNIEKAGMKERIKALKGDSSQILLNLIAESPVTHKDKNGVSHIIWGFDFIYVDASHLCLDCFVDCILSWKLLKKGGIMGIDDYMYNIGYRNVLEIPFEGVNRFLEKIEGQYKVLNKGYRLFIQKL